MREFELGYFAFSKAGHDAGKLYVIMKQEGEYIYLMDGKYKCLSNPKKKNIKHIQPVNSIDSDLQDKIRNNIEIKNDDIKRAIKCYKA